jgi:hypothetical protein
MGSLRRSIVLSSLKKVPTISKVNQDNHSPARQVYGLNKVVPINAKKPNRVQLPQLNSFVTTRDSSNQDRISSAKKDAGSFIFGQTSSSHRKLLSSTSRTDGQNMNINDHFKL